MNLYIPISYVGYGFFVVMYWLVIYSYYLYIDLRCTNESTKVIFIPISYIGYGFFVIVH